MPTLRIIPEGSVPEMDADGHPIHEAAVVSVTGLASGMASGAAAVALIVRLPDGRQVFAPTSLALFLQAADALRIRHGDPRQPLDPSLKAGVAAGVSDALGVCGEMWPCLRPKDHQGRCATMVEVCAHG